MEKGLVVLVVATILLSVATFISGYLLAIDIQSEINSLRKKGIIITIELDMTTEPKYSLSIFHYKNFEYIKIKTEPFLYRTYEEAQRKGIEFVNIYLDEIKSKGID